jgi:hypothetical protein
MKSMKNGATIIRKSKKNKQHNGQMLAGTKKDTLTKEAKSTLPNRQTHDRKI